MALLKATDRHIWNKGTINPPSWMQLIIVTISILFYIAISAIILHIGFRGISIGHYSR